MKTLKASEVTKRGAYWYQDEPLHDWDVVFYEDGWFSWTDNEGPEQRDWFADLPAHKFVGPIPPPEVTDDDAEVPGTGGD